MAKVAFTTRMEMSKIFADEAQRHGIRYYHLWAKDELGQKPSILNGTSTDISADMKSKEIMDLYQKETYNIEMALQSFPKQLLNQQI